MGIVINNQNRREEYEQIAQLQNQINAYLADPNVDNEAKSEARKQMEVLSQNISQQNMRKGVARQHAIQTLNAVAASLQPSSVYTPEYITPTAGLKEMVNFNPKLTEKTYRVSGKPSDLKESVEQFSNMLISELGAAAVTLADDNKVLVGWKKENSDLIQGWINELKKPATTEEELKNKVDFIGNTIVSALGNDQLSNAFVNKFENWLETEEEYLAKRQAQLQQQQEQEAIAPADLANYSNLTTKGYRFKKEGDKYKAYDVAGNLITSGDGYIQMDFTSPDYKSGWIITDDGTVEFIQDFSDVATNAGFVQSKGWQHAISSAKEDFANRYPSVFNFNSIFQNQYPFGTGINHTNRNFVDLSYYFPGDGYVLGVQKDSDADSFTGYNWNEDDRQFYVSKDKTTWEVVQGMAEVRRVLGLDDNDGFNYSGADLSLASDPDKHAQFSTSKYLQKPHDWDEYILQEGKIPKYGKYVKALKYSNRKEFLADLIKAALPGNLAKGLKEIVQTKGLTAASEIKLLLESQTKKQVKPFFKSLFLEAQAAGFDKDTLAALLIRFNFGDQMPLNITEEEAKRMVTEAHQQQVVTQAKGGVLKFSEGGSWYLEYANTTPVSKSISSNTDDVITTKDNSMQGLIDRADASGRSIEGQAIGEGSFKLDGPMTLRLAALTADVAGLISSFAPGGGTLAAGAAGVVSFGADWAADAIDDSVTKGEVASNAAANLFFGIVGLIPGGKVWKVTKTLGALGGSLYSLGVISVPIYNKIKNGESLTYDDWKSVLAGLSTIVNTGTMARSAYTLKKMKSNQTPTGSHTIKSDQGEFKVTDAQLKEIDRIGRKEGHTKAVDKVKEFLKQNSDYSEESINKAIFEFEYRHGKDNNKGLSQFGGRPKKSILDVASPEYKTELSKYDEFYQNDPYRRGNLNTSDAYRSTKRPRVFISDYGLVNNPNAKWINPNSKLAKLLNKFNLIEPLKKIAYKVSDTFIKGDSYDARHNKRVAVTVNGNQEIRHIPKENELIVRKEGTKQHVVELAPMKDSKGELIEGKYINFDNPNEVYVKTKNGTFKKQTASPKSTPLVQNTDIQTEMSNLNAQVTLPFTRYKQLGTDSDFTNGINMIPKDKRLTPNQVISMIKDKTGNEVKVRLGGWINKKGELVYRNTGGKLDRLNNYLNTK